MIASAPLVKQRIASIDILRGLIMLIMALDHVRDFFHQGGPNPTDLATTTPILFFTRWITHFCAPTFIFLSGISAYLAGTRRSKAQLSSFLIKRGLWLLVVEMVLITFALTLNPFYNVIIWQVIWAIGTSMIILGLLVWLPLPVIGVIGAVLFFGHNLLDGISTANVAETILFKAAGFGQSMIQLNPSHYIMDAYAILPWTGVMLIGYCFGSLYANNYDAAKRKRLLLSSGVFLFVLFLLLRMINKYGDPAPWAVQKTTALTVISFFNVTKYPCSLMYLGMTLGVSIFSLSLIENARSKFAGILTVYGNVPFFYYVLHFYLIKVVMIIVFFASGYTTADIIPKRPGGGFMFSPPGFGFNLGGVYLVWLLVICTLYFPCRWFSKYKRTHQQWWLSYL
jgi:uncharacterized membrane protein